MLMVSDLVANMARREENVAASSFRAFSSFLSFIIVSVTMDFSASYLLFRLARATSAVWINTHTHIFNKFRIFSNSHSHFSPPVVLPNTPLTIYDYSV